MTEMPGSHEGESSDNRPPEPEDVDVPGDIAEDVVPREGPVAAVTYATVQLRRWVVAGVGALAALSIVLSIATVLIRPELEHFVTTFLQLVVGGLIGLAGSVIGFLFGREKS